MVLLTTAATFARFVPFFQNCDGLRWCVFFWGVENTFPHTPLSEIEPKLASLGLQRPKRKLFLPDLKVAGVLYRQCRDGYRHRREDIVSAPESSNHCRSYLHHDFAEFRRFSCARTIVRAEVRVILRDRRNFLICTMPPRTGWLGRYAYGEFANTRSMFGRRREGRGRTTPIFIKTGISGEQ